MTKQLISKVLKAHLGIFEDIKFKYGDDHVIVSHDDPNSMWASSEIESIVDVCRGLKLSYYLDEKGFYVYSRFYSAL